MNCNYFGLFLTKLKLPAEGVKITPKGAQNFKDSMFLGPFLPIQRWPKHFIKIDFIYADHSTQFKFLNCNILFCL